MATVSCKYDGIDPSCEGSFDNVEDAGSCTLILLDGETQVVYDVCTTCYAGGVIDADVDVPPAV